jgi:hypothetical protein
MGQSSGSNCHADTYSSESADGRGPCPAPPLVLTTCLDDLANSSMSWALAAGSPSTETADFTSWWRCRHCDSGHASRSPFAATPRPAGNPGVGNALAGQQHDPRSLRRAARTLAHRRRLEILPMPCHGIACGANTDSKRDFGSGEPIAYILGVAAALFVLMFRRDHGIHGLVGLTSGPPWRPAPAT